jgi:hypothetical protein
MDPTPHGPNPKWTQTRMDPTQNGLNLEWTRPRIDSTLNGLKPRMDSTPNGLNPKRTQSRLGLNHEWTQPWMDSTPKGTQPQIPLNLAWHNFYYSPFLYIKQYTKLFFKWILKRMNIISISKDHHLNIKVYFFLCTWTKTKINPEEDWTIWC